MGESCFEEGLYEAARVIFTRMPSWGRLASTLVRLHQFQAAVDAARKANSPKTWKEVRSAPSVWPRPSLLHLIYRMQLGPLMAGAHDRYGRLLPWRLRRPGI